MPRSKNRENHPYTVLANQWVAAGIDPRPFFGKAGINPEFFFPPLVRQLLGTTLPIDNQTPVLLPGPDAPPLVLLTKAEQRKLDKEQKAAQQANLTKLDPACGSGNFFIIANG